MTTKRNSLYYHDYYVQMYEIKKAFGYGERKGKGIWYYNIVRGVNNTPKRIGWRSRYFGRLLTNSCTFWMVI